METDPLKKETMSYDSLGSPRVCLNFYLGLFLACEPKLQGLI